MKIETFCVLSKRKQRAKVNNKLASNINFYILDYYPYPAAVTVLGEIKFVTERLIQCERNFTSGANIEVSKLNCTCFNRV